MRLIRGLLALILAPISWLWRPSVRPIDLPPGEIVTGVFHDARRKRDVPFKLYCPPSSEEPAPVVLFSHGLAGSREAAPYLGQALSKAGYYAFFLQHADSDSAIIQGATSRDQVLQRASEAIRKPGNASARFSDISFAINQIEALNRSGRLEGKLDLDRIGLAGHSYGARTTMAIAGQRMGAFGTRFRDPRVKAGLVLSPNAPNIALTSPGGIYDKIGIPLFHMTGTNDGMPLEGVSFDPRMRILPFRLIKRKDQYLLVLDGATHGTFSGRDFGGEEGQDPRYAKLVARGAVLFFNAYLRRDREAHRQLRQDFRHLLAPGDTFETK